MLTRRTVVQGAAGAALAAALPARIAGAQDVTGLVKPPLGAALEPELVTVTESAAVAWWRTEEPADTVMRVTALDGPQAGVTREVRSAGPDTVHVARVEGLAPGTRYGYELLSDGRSVSTGLNREADPREFRTLVVPSGRLLATIAVLNDLHVGETCSGQIRGTPLGGLPPCETGDDYAYRMVESAVGELAGMKLDLVVANGDLTDRGRPDEVRRALELLRRLPVPLLVTRGNHDRRLKGACAADGDCLRAQAFPQQPDGQGTLLSLARVGERLAVVGLDSCDPDSGAGRLDLGDQPAWLDARLAELRAEGRHVIVCFHHPILTETDPPQVSDGVDPELGGDAVRAVLARHEHVRMVVSGHSHRNNLGFDPAIGQRLPFLENGAIKEYPAGYALLRVHEDGIVRTFHRPDTPWAREWTRTSAQQIYGLHPTATRGALTSRAFVARHGRIEGAGTAGAGRTIPVRLDVPRRREMGRFLALGLPVVVGAPPGATVSVRLTSGGLTIASATRLVPGRRLRLRLRAPRRLRDRLRRRRNGVRATLRVRVALPGRPTRTIKRDVLLR